MKTKKDINLDLISLSNKLSNQSIMSHRSFNELSLNFNNLQNDLKLIKKLAKFHGEQTFDQEKLEEVLKLIQLNFQQMNASYSNVQKSINKLYHELTQEMNIVIEGEVTLNPSDYKNS